MGTLIEVDRLETSLPLVVVIDKDGVGGVTGLSPTVALRLLPSTTTYLDWGDMTFKSSGWTTKYQVMGAVERGNYQQLLDVSALALPAGTKLSAEFFVDNGSDVKGESADLFLVIDARAQIDFLRKVATNRLEEVSGNPGRLTLYDDDGVATLMSWDIRDESGGAVLPTVGAPAKRGAGT